MFAEAIRKFEEMDDYIFCKLIEWVIEYELGNAPKARVDYWLKKGGVTWDELTLYLIYIH